MLRLTSRRILGPRAGLCANRVSSRARKKGRSLIAHLWCQEVKNTERSSTARRLWKNYFSNSRILTFDLNLVAVAAPNLAASFSPSGNLRILKCKFNFLHFIIFSINSQHYAKSIFKIGHHKKGHRLLLEHRISI